MPSSIPLPGLNLLLALGRYHYLTSAQATRLLFSENSRSYTQEHLKKLVDMGYAEKGAIPTSTSGNPTGVWHMSRRGETFLANQGYDILPLPNRARKDHWLFFYEHIRAVNDVMIAAAVLERDGVLTILREEHDRQLKRSPIAVPLSDGSRYKVIPDCWLTVQVGKMQMGIAFEVDRATLTEQRFRRKIEGLLVMADGAYRERFETEALAIAITVPDQRRLEKVRHWIELELKRLDLENWNEVFFLTTVDPARSKPYTFYFGSHWQHPLRGGSYPLLEELT